MKVWTDLRAYTPESDRPLVLAMGNFDGVHRGHQKILESVIQHAKKIKGIPAVLTFNEHPQRVLHNSQGPSLLTSPQHRLLLFEAWGIEVCFLLHFTLEFSRTGPEEFVEKWLVNRLKAREIHLGYNAHFGAGRKGNGELMKKLAPRFGFDFFEIQPLKVKNEFISSTTIRNKILQGDLESAEAFLGRPFGIFATVVRGKGIGESLGFPTANLRPHSEILPPQGVYLAQAREHAFHLEAFGGKGTAFEYWKEPPGPWHQGVLNLGMRPTFSQHSGSTGVVAEVYLLNFSGKLYGKTMEVIFYPRIRDEKRFSSPKELSAAIQGDVEEAKRYFLYKKIE